MATRVRIVMYAPNESIANAAAAAAFGRMADIESLISDYRLESEVSTLREAAAGVWVDLSEDLSAVLAEAARATRQSDGAFDVGCGRMTSSWRLARSSGEQPQDWSRWVRSHGPGSGRLEVRQRQVRFETPIPWIDCGGIGKGFAADQALSTLMAYGIDVALVELGGDIALGGPPPGTDGWSIDWAIGDLAVKPASLQLSWCGVATSGAGEQHISTGEQFASHVIDPRTGVWVGRHANITVIAPTAAQADALASAGCVIGRAALRQRLIDQPLIRVY